MKRWNYYVEMCKSDMQGLCVDVFVVYVYVIACVWYTAQTTAIPSW